MTAPNDGAYTIRLSKGAALLSETKLILREWDGNETAAELADRILEADLLGKATARRVRDIIQRVFAIRYLQPDGCPATYLKTLISEKAPGDWFRDICLLYSARADRLICDGVTQLLRGARDEGRLVLSVDAAVAFLNEAEQNGRMEQPWSSEVKKKIARGLLKVLAEFGFLTLRGRGPREILNFHPHPVAVAFLAFDLHFRGITDAGIPNHEDWQLWLLDGASVREYLDRLSGHGLWVFQAAGAVVRITWNVSTMEEAVDVLVGLNI